MKLLVFQRCTAIVFLELPVEIVCVGDSAMLRDLVDGTGTPGQKNGRLFHSHHVQIVVEADAVFLNEKLSQIGGVDVILAGKEL